MKRIQHVILFLILITPIYLFSKENISIGGTYRFGKDIDKENVGEILVVPKANNLAIIYITTSKKAPSYNTFTLLTKIEIIDNKAYYQTKTSSGKLGFIFSKNSIKIIDNESITFSHFPINNIEFKKVSDKIPEHFTRGDGKSIELKETVDNFEKNYFPNTSIWEFIGVWQFGQGKESLNISKNLANDNLHIQYNSWSDGFEDRFFENCKFTRGKIIGDYYGSKRNVILEIEEGNLILTIDPSHQFQPIKKQLFKKLGKFIFKYNSSNNNEYFLNKPNSKGTKIDSLPPSDRILIHNKNDDKLFFKSKYYIKRYNKTLIQNKNLYVSSKNLRNSKPLFPKNLHLIGFANLNKSELFVQRLYLPEKREKNIHIVSIPGQNRVGQKKLFIEKDIYSKLGLHNIKNYNANPFITGTVDLCNKLYTLVIDYQYENEFETYLVNYTLDGEYIDHILIGRDDYVESMTPIKSFFAPGEIYVNSMVQKWVEDGIDIGSSYYQTFKTIRYIVNQKGQFIASNFDTSFIHKPELSFKIANQPVKSKTYGNVSLSLYQNYIDINYSGGYVISMHTKIETESGIKFIIPMDLSSVAGFYYPPFGDFIGPNGELQKLFYTNYKDGIRHLKFSFTLKDMNNDGLDDLIMKMIDTSYVVEPEEEFLFFHNGSEWILYENQS